MERKTFNVYLALGANLGDTRATFLEALRRIQTELGDILGVSCFHSTVPLNHPDTPDLDQPTYLNAVVACRTELLVERILALTQEIEKSHGRTRSKELRWGPRTLDIDIVAIDDLVLDSPNLKIPHVEMHKRTFVLEPMAEIASGWIHPRFKKSVAEMLAKLRT